jgi:Fe2+ transport system protein FeoA
MDGKLKTEDCVKFLCEGECGGQPSEWKRRSKSKDGNAIVRVFENMSTGDRVNVFEVDGKLYLDTTLDQCKKVGDGWLFAICDNEDSEQGWVVYTNPKAEWDKRHVLDDRGTTQVIDEALLTLALECQAENFFEPSSILSKEETKAKLEEMGFVNDPAFQKFCEEDESSSAGSDDEEDDDDEVVVSGHPGEGYLFAISDSEDAGEGWIVCITHSAYWQRNHCMDDRGIAEELYEVLQEIGLDEVMESTFEPDGDWGKPEMKAKLEELGFVNDPAFQKFCENPEDEG